MIEEPALFDMPTGSRAKSRHHIMQRGYANPPGTGPAGETCGSCKHIVRTKRYRKCSLRKATWTHGPGSDVLARAPACKSWTRPEGGEE